jgi:hypothetical protein
MRSTAPWIRRSAPRRLLDAHRSATRRIRSAFALAVGFGARNREVSHRVVRCAGIANVAEVRTSPARVPRGVLASCADAANCATSKTAERRSGGYREAG